MNPIQTVLTVVKSSCITSVIIIRVVPDTDLAGYPATGYPANNFAGYPAWPDTGYPAK